MDPEIIGSYLPVRLGSEWVPDIPPGPEWNKLNDAHKRIQIIQYADSCETRRKLKITRLRKMMQERLNTPSMVSTHSGFKVKLKSLSAEEIC